MLTKKVFGLISCVCFFGMIFINDAHAEMISSENLYKMALFTGVEQCYQEYAKDSEPAADLTNVFDIFENNFQGKKIISVPTLVGNNLNSDEKLSCLETFKTGRGEDAKGLENYYTLPTDVGGYGYEISSEETINTNSTGNIHAVEISIKSILGDDGNKIENINISTAGNMSCMVAETIDGNNYVWRINNCNGDIRVIDNDSGMVIAGFRAFDIEDGAAVSGVTDYEAYTDNRPIMESLIDRVNVEFEGFDLDDKLTIYDSTSEKTLSSAMANSSFMISIGDFMREAIGYWYRESYVVNNIVRFNYKTSGDISNAVYVPINNDKISAALYFLNNLGIDRTLPNQAAGRGTNYYRYVWSPTAIYSLYYKYLLSVVRENQDIKIDSCGTQIVPNARYNFKNKSDQWCKIVIPSSKQDDLLKLTFSVVEGGNRLSQGTFSDVLAWFNRENVYNDIPEDGFANLPVDAEGNLLLAQALDGDDSNEKDEDRCYNASGSLGWIVCPLMGTMSEALGHIYDNMIEPFLIINPGLVETSGGTWNGWNVMVGIANISMVIYLLVIIFSQVTGVGIDNYGIKRSLPKIIMAAILINLSFIICQLAVDVSNIVGNSLNEFLSNIEVAGLPDGLSEIGNDNAVWFDTLFTLTGGGLITIEVLTVTSSIISEGLLAGLIIPILLLVVTALVAVLFFFILLGVRKAGVVILVILAPVAIACYTLPNMKKYFDKWLKMLQGLLLLYPICGLLIGGGQLASKIILSVSDDYMMYFTGCIIMVVPFFLVPTLLRGSFAAMGNIGAKISGIGKTLGARSRGRLENVIKNDAGYKERVQYNQQRYAANRAQRIRNRLSGRTNLDARERDQLRRAEDVILAQRKREAEDSTRMGGEYFTAMSNKQDLAVRAEANAIARMNDSTVLEAERQSLEDRARMERSKARTALMMNQYRGEGPSQLQARWETAFKSGNEDELEGLTNVIIQRYGAAGANIIAKSLNSMTGVAGNKDYQASLRTLQRTMDDNVAFAGAMRSKASDAYQMISEAGTTGYDSAGKPIYGDLSYFSAHNEIAKSAKDWATSSAATLQRAVDSEALDENMMKTLLTSDVPEITAGLQSETEKRQILEAGLYNKEHGTSLSTTEAASKYEEAIANAPIMIRQGIYRDPSGNVHRLREMSDGRYLDDNGFEVQIEHFKRQGN